MKKFEQVSRDGHQMSLAGGRVLYSKAPCQLGAGWSPCSEIPLQKGPWGPVKAHVQREWGLGGEDPVQ